MAAEEIYRLALLHGLDLSILPQQQRTKQPNDESTVATVPWILPFDYLPIEIRLKIYKLLNVNLGLGEGPVVDVVDVLDLPRSLTEQEG